MLVRELPEGTSLADVEEIRIFQTATDVVIARASNPPPGFDDKGFEGYVYRQPPKLNPVGLLLYRNPTTGDLLATTRQPPPAYEMVERLGFTVQAP